MPNDDMIRLRNKRTGQVVTVPRSQYASGDDSRKGVSGILEDLGTSARSFVPATEKMIRSIPGGVKSIADYSTSNNPVETLGNIGAGGVESIAGLFSSPKILARYLADKFPAYGKLLEQGRAMRGERSLNDPTLHEALMEFEKKHGLAARDEKEQSVRNLGGLLFVGKGLTKIGGRAARVGTLAAQQAGEGGDPLHAAILGMLGEMGAKRLGRNINPKNEIEIPPDKEPPAGPSGPNGTPVFGTTPQASIPSVMNQAPFNVSLGGLGYAPQMAKNIVHAAKEIPKQGIGALGTALQNSADYVSAIPGVGKVIAPIAQPILGMTGTKLKYASTSPKTMAKEKLFGDITKKDLAEMEERNAAAKRMGINPTLAELSQDAYEAAKQGEIGKTKEGQKALYKAGETSDASQEKAINELFNMIHEDRLEPTKKAAYEDTMAREVPQEFIDKHIQNPAIQKAMNLVKNNTAFKQLLYDEYGVSDVDKVPKNSLMYWDFVKRALHEIESKSGRKGGKTEPAVFSRIRNRMVDDLDKIAPRYKEARNIAERGFTRNDLEKVFDKKTKTFNNFDSYLKSKENFTELTKKLQAFPEALQRLNDIKMFSGKMIPNNPGVRAAAALKRTSMSEPRNYLAAKHLKQLQKYGENHDVAQVNLMTHPDLMTLLKKHLAEKGKL